MREKMEIDTITLLNGANVHKESTNYSFRRQKMVLDNLIKNYRDRKIDRLHFLKCASRHYGKNNEN